MKKFKNVKISLTIISVILIIFTLSIYIFNNKKELVNRLNSTIYYLTLNSDRQELYNKLMISHIEVTSRTTGTAPFNSGSSSTSEGIDVTAADNYVRTLDTVQYKLEVTTKPNNGEYSSSETSGLTGGVIKVKATLPNQGDEPNMIWITDAWMKNPVITENGTVITAEYHVSSGTNITSAIQELSFSFKIGGYKIPVSSNMLPEFEVWMEGNSPENPSSQAPSKTIKDTNKPFIISGTQSYNISVTKDHENYSISQKNINGQEVSGRYKKLPIAVTFTKLSGMPDYRGVEFPKNNFNIDLDLSYRYSINGGAYTTITSSTVDAIDILNGTSIQAYDINGRLNSDFIPNTEDMATAQQHPYGSIELGNVNNSVYNSGDFTATLNGNNLKVNFKNFEIVNTYPTTPSNAVSALEFNKNEGYILTGVVEFFLPFYGDNSTENDYYLDVLVKNATYERIDGTTGTIAKGTNVINDTNQNDNVTNISFQNNLENIILIGMYTIKDGIILESGNYQYGDASLYIGDQFYTEILHGQGDGDFLGGQQILVTWDANMVEPYPNNNKYYQVYNSTGCTYSRDNITMKFGVSKTTPTTGLTTLEELNAALMTSFTWYDTYEEAAAAGKVTAALYDDPDMYGNGHFRYYYNYFRMVNNPDNVGKTAVVRSKAYAYADAARTKRYSSRTQAYTPTIYDTNGKITSYESDWYVGKTILAKNNEASIRIESVEDGSRRVTYDIQDNIVNYEVTPTISTAETLSGIIIPNTYIYVTLEEGLTYIENSSNKTPQSVVVNSDGTTSITWLYEDWQAGTPAPEFPKITFQAEISPTTENNKVYITKAVIFNSGDLRDESKKRTSTSSIKIVNLTGVHLSKKVNKKYLDIGEELEVTTTIGTSSGKNFKTSRITEILPKNNINSRKINGSYTIYLKEINEKQSVYYSTKPIETLGLKYEDDKYSSQGVSLTSPNWIRVYEGSTIPAEATVMISEFNAIAEATTFKYIYTINTTNNLAGDTFVFNSVFSSVNSTSVISNNELTAHITNRSISGEVILEEGTPNLNSEVNVTLLNSNNEVIASTTTKNKKYIFDNLSKGQYYVQFEIPQYYIISNTLSNTVDSNGKTYLITEQNDPPTEETIKVENINMVLSKKKAKLTIHHYIENSTTPLVDSITEDYFLGDKYSTSVSQEISSNYELALTPSNKTGTITSDTTVIYYYKLKTAKITINHYLENTTTKLVDSEEMIKKYTDEYTTTPIFKDNNYELVATPKNYKGVVNGNITVNYYYKLKTATITVNHYIEDTNNKIAETESFHKKYTEEYSTSPVNNDNYDMIRSTSNTNGIVSGDVEVNYYYRLKTSTITVNHYVEGTTNKLYETVTFKQQYTTEYTTEPLTANQNYELVATPENSKGTVKGNITVNYYYKLKTATITVKHYLENTEIEFAKEDILEKNYTESYEVAPKIKDNNYETIGNPENYKGIVNGDIIVIYYYRLKTATITVNHYLEGTTSKLADSVIFTQQYTSEYITERVNIGQNYEAAGDSKNTSGTVTGDITVNYYYRLKGASLIVNYYKEGTTQTLSKSLIIPVKWGDNYTTNEPEDIPNSYELIETPSNYKGIISNDKVEVNYYYRLKTATITVNHYLENTTTKLVNSEEIIKNYTEKYTTEPVFKDNNYEVAKTPANASGTVNGNIEVNYYYRLKTATITVKHYLEGTETELAKEDSFKKKYTENYVTEAKIEDNNYELIENPENYQGIVNGDIIVIYYYRLKTATITINHYLEGTTTELLKTETEYIKYTEKYETKPTSVNENYELKEVPKNASGTVTSNITIDYYYKLKDATLIVNHYIIGTETELAATQNIPMKWGESYSTVPASSISENYELAQTPNNSTGIIKGDVIVTYYYKLKDSKIIIKHLEKGTNKDLAATEEIDTKFGEKYTTEISSEIPKNYTFFSKTDNFTGTVSQSTIEVIYYYMKIDSNLSTSIKITGPSELTSREEKLKYTINYEATINEYIGNGIITITDKLPYEIDESKSELDGGTYNKETKTITWIIEESDINSFNDNNKVNIKKEIILLYKDIVIKDKTFVNSVTGHIKLDNNEQTIEDKSSTSISIKGTIIIHHYLEGTKTKISDDIKTSDYIYETYISSALIKDGYILTKKPEVETHIYQEEPLEIIYEYSRIKLHITTKVDGNGGVVEGDEDVYYGDDSTPDKIVIKAQDGYDIAEIIVNGETYQITDKKTMVLSAIKNVQKDIIVQVKFIESKKEEIENPNTSMTFRIISVIGLCTISLIISIIYKKFKNKFVKI